MPSLVDKLKSLGVKVGTADLAPARPASRLDVDAVVPGEYRPTRQGDVFVISQRFPLAAELGLVVSAGAVLVVVVLEALD